MCGIAGLVSFARPLTPDDVAAVRRMTEAQASRGPDDAGLFSDEHVALGHRRLSILDLSQAGHQPMTNEEGAVWITYNGEIYNSPELRDELVALGQVFRSHSDTEVLIHGYRHWGIERLLSKLEGMFAFVLYDRRNGSVLLARDRLGIKPLYYASLEHGDLLCFASEVKAVLAGNLVKRECDGEALAGFLLLGSVPSPATINRNVQCLPPGHFLLSERGRLTSRRYWDLESSDFEAASVEVDGAAARLGVALRDAVAKHLLSDAPLGVFLSGGMDSAGLVALAARAREQRLVTLTVTFKDRLLDEADEARRVAQTYATEHHETRITGSDFIRELPALLGSLDQPTNDGINTYFVSKAARSLGLKTVLSGLGGDEIFWGYAHYRWLAGRMPWMRILSNTPIPLLKMAAAGAAEYGRIRGREKLMRLGYLGHRPSPAGLYFAVRGFFAMEQAGRLLGRRSSELTAIADAALAEVPAGADRAACDVFNFIERKRYLHDQLLRDCDVLSMAHSIETRVPYLDHRVVARVVSLPARMKVRNGTNKPLLLRAVPEPAVADAARRTKKGFSLPMQRWMQDHRDALREIVLQTKVLDPAEAARLFREFEVGRLHWSRAWALVVLGASGKWD